MRKTFPFNRILDQNEIEVILCNKAFHYRGDIYAGVWLEDFDGNEIKGSYFHCVKTASKSLLSRTKGQARKLQDWMDEHEKTTGEKIRIAGIEGTFTSHWKYDGLGIKHRLLSYDFALWAYNEMTCDVFDMPVVGGRRESNWGEW